MSSSLNTFTPEMSDVIRTTVDAMMLDMYFCLPAKVVSYDPGTQYADVEIQLYTARIDGTLSKYPVIPNVPVKHPKAAGGKAFIHMPIASGDDVILVFSQRSLDNWKSSGGMSDPNDPRKSHITDAFALIGGSAIPDSFSVGDPTTVEISNGKAKVQVFPDGKFKIKNDSGELISLIQQLVQTLSQDTVNTIFGPMKLNAFATYAQIANKLTDFME